MRQDMDLNVEGARGEGHDNSRTIVPHCFVAIP
jgi:hypothetical protein